MKPIPKSESARYRMARELLRRLVRHNEYAMCLASGAEQWPAGTTGRLLQDSARFLRETDTAKETT
jgi:hypothetical protein